MTNEDQDRLRRTPRLMSEIEEALFDADDDEVLAAPAMRSMAVDARAVVEAASRAARTRAAVPSREMRQVLRRLPRRAAPRRVMMREVLVANPRARDIVGKRVVDTMTDAEIEAALERLASLGMLPDEIED